MICSRLVIFLVVCFAFQNFVFGSLSLNAPCSGESEHECGINAFCSAVDHECWCKFGTTPNSTTDCSAMECFDDSECREHFGSLAQCPIFPAYKRFCDCSYSTHPNVYFNAIRQKCLLASSGKKACDHDYQCGDEMICHRVNMIERECRCKFGYKRLHRLKCDLINCRDDFECKMPNSKCNSKGTCACADNFELENNNVCVHINRESKKPHESQKPQEPKEPQEPQKPQEPQEESSGYFSVILYVSIFVGVMLFRCGFVVGRLNKVKTPNEIESGQNRIETRTTTEFVQQNQTKPLVDDDSLPTYEEVIRNDK